MGRAIVNACGSRSFYAASFPVVWSGRSTSLPFSNVAPARTSATRCGAFTARQRDCEASISLYAMAIPVARDPGPLVILLRSRNVATRAGPGSPADPACPRSGRGSRATCAVGLPVSRTIRTAHSRNSRSKFRVAKGPTSAQERSRFVERGDYGLHPARRCERVGGWPPRPAAPRARRRCVSGADQPAPGAHPGSPIPY
jgi:hypothetical protein